MDTRRVNVIKLFYLLLMIRANKQEPFQPRFKLEGKVIPYLIRPIYYRLRACYPEPS